MPIVRNLGALFDQHVIMDKQVHAVCTSAYYHVRNISRIRRYLTKPATQILVYSLVTTRLNYCNSLLYGVPRRTLAKLQRVQNAAARLVARSSPSPAHHPSSEAVTLASCGVPCEIQDSTTPIQGLTWENSFLHQRVSINGLSDSFLLTCGGIESVAWHSKIAGRRSFGPNKTGPH